MWMFFQKQFQWVIDSYNGSKPKYLKEMSISVPTGTFRTFGGRGSDT